MTDNREKKVYDIGIMVKVGWNFHSLNNEGTVGNVVEPRTLVLPGGEKTDGISGEMLKHVNHEYFWQLTKASDEKGKLCEGCEQKRPERANRNTDAKEKGRPEEVMEEAIKCPTCDIHGFLINQPSISRKSTIQVGWAVGIPEDQEIKSHTHIRKSPHENFVQSEEVREVGDWSKYACSEEECDTDEDESKLFKVNNKWYCKKHLETQAEQMIYHRPTRSGNYALIMGFQPWRIGYNDISTEYTDDVDRKLRYKNTIDSIENMLLRPDGAMTTTRLPHIKDIKGSIILTETVNPAPIISPLKEDYQETLKKFEVEKGIDILSFSDEAELKEKLEEIKEYTPFRLE